MKNLTQNDKATISRLLADLAPNWTICSHLPFLADGVIHAVIVGQKKDDPRYYVFRAYSHIADCGIEYESRHNDLASAVAARSAATYGHADDTFEE